MDSVTVSLDFHGRQIQFTHPSGEDIQRHLKDVLAGQTYPMPRLPKNYRWGDIVDVGANVGASAVWFQSLAPASRLVCFEPAAESFRYLTANIATFANAEPCNWGLFSSATTAVLHHGRNHSLQHSVAPNIETGPETETIQLKRASAEWDRLALKRVSVLKVDTEGCEVPILQDLGQRLQVVDMVYVEWHSDEDRRAIDALLADRFLLNFATARMIHRGTALYVAREVAEAIPWAAALRVVRPPYLSDSGGA